MANGHGGRRTGAGRPRKAVKYERQIAAAEDRIADTLAERLDALELLAAGGFEQISETWEPAGLIFVGSGEFQSLAFPQLPPDQLVCVKRVRSIAAPDRTANIYLIDRILGKPTQAIDVDADPDGSLEQTAASLSAAAQELAAWRQRMTDELSSMPSAPPTLPTPATPTD